MLHVCIIMCDLNKTLKSDRAPPKKSDNLYFRTKDQQLILTTAHIDFKKNNINKIWNLHIPCYPMFDAVSRSKNQPICPKQRSLVGRRSSSCATAGARPGETKAMAMHLGRKLV